MTEMPWYNKGLFSSLNLRQKTLLTIGLTGLVLLVIFISAWMIDANLPTIFAIKMDAIMNGTLRIKHAPRDGNFQAKRTLKP